MEIQIGYALLRLSLGFNLFMHGFVRIYNGRQVFTAALEKEFENTLLPKTAVKLFAGLLPPLELLTGLLLCAGLFTKLSLITGWLVMMLLLFGKSIKADWQVVSLQMIYVAFYGWLMVCLQSNHLSLDQIFFG